MSKSLGLFVLFGVLMLFPAGGAQARRAAPAKTQYRWARISIVQVLPSQVFSKLGLTHSTRYGFTRDGYTKQTPDPTFPVGLTDIVPYDTSHLLLVRGTPQALSQFRQRVLATETELVTTERWHVSVDLLSGQDGEVVGPAAQQDVVTDVPFVVSVGDASHPRTYRLRVHVNPDATTVVLCQSGLLPMPTGEARAVLTPAQVWTPAVGRPVFPGGAVTFDDRAVDRQASLRRLKLPEDADAQDYRLGMTVTAPAAPAGSAGMTPPSEEPAPQP